MNTCAFSPDGTRIVSASGDYNLKIWDANTGIEISQYLLAGWCTAVAWSPDGSRLVAGDSSGAVHILKLENVSLGPPVVTAWQNATYAFGCPFCRVWSRVPNSALSTELPCPSCGKTVKLNPFTIHADWRPIARAWGNTE